MDRIKKKFLILIFILPFVFLYGCKEEHEHRYLLVSTSFDCVEGGYKLFQCECGKTYQELIEPANHVWKYVEGLEEKTCTKDGVYLYECTVCGLRDVRIDPHEGHKYIEDGDYFHSICLNGCGQNKIGTIDYLNENYTLLSLKDYDGFFSRLKEARNKIIYEDSIEKYDMALHGYSETGELANSYQIFLNEYFIPIFVDLKKTIDEQFIHRILLRNLNYKNVDVEYDSLLELEQEINDNYYYFLEMTFSSCYKEYYFNENNPYDNNVKDIKNLQDIETYINKLKYETNLKSQIATFDYAYRGNTKYNVYNEFVFLNMIYKNDAKSLENDDFKSHYLNDVYNLNINDEQLRLLDGSSNGYLFKKMIQAKDFTKLISEWRINETAAAINSKSPIKTNQNIIKGFNGQFIENPTIMGWVGDFLKEISEECDINLYEETVKLFTEARIYFSINCINQVFDYNGFKGIIFQQNQITPFVFLRYLGRYYSMISDNHDVRNDKAMLIGNALEYLFLIYLKNKIDELAVYNIIKLDAIKNIHDKTLEWLVIAYCENVFKELDLTRYDYTSIIKNTYLDAVQEYINSSKTSVIHYMYYAIHDPFISTLELLSSLEMLTFYNNSMNDYSKAVTMFKQILSIDSSNQQFIVPIDEIGLGNVFTDEYYNIFNEVLNNINAELISNQKE